jgi:hypothetical protein
VDGGQNLKFWGFFRFFEFKRSKKQLLLNSNEVMWC